jgi:hypothetical protein
MIFPQTWTAGLGRNILERLAELAHTLEVLIERVRDEVSRLVGQAVAGALREAVRSVLGQGRPAFTSASRSWWRGERQPALWDEAGYGPVCSVPDEYDDEEALSAESAAPANPPPLRVRAALVLGCRAFAWWLRRQAGRFTAATAIAIGIVAAAAAYAVGPALTTSLVGLLALADVVQSGAEAINSSSAYRTPPQQSGL